MIEVSGTIWGWVNYNPDGPPHERQFVVQRGEQLCRCIFHVRDLKPNVRVDWPNPLRELHDEFQLEADESILAKMAAGTLEFDKARNYERRGHSGDYRLLFQTASHPFFGRETVAMGKSPDDSLGFIRDECYYWLTRDESGPARRNGEDFTAEQMKARAHESLIDKIRKAGYREGNMATPEECEERLETLGRQAAAYVERWNALMVRLRAVEQLFIAV